MKILKKITEIGINNLVVMVGRKVKFVLLDIAALWEGFVRPGAAIAYLGFVGHKNLGDEILYDGHKVLFGKVKLVHINYYLTLKIATALKPRFFRRALLGGGTLIDHSQNWLTRVDVLLKNGTDLYCIGTGVEDPEYWPQDMQRFAHLDRWVQALSQFKFVGVRGPYSKQILENAGLKGVVQTGDTALALTVDAHKALIGKNVRTIGVTYGITPGQTQWGKRAKYTKSMVNVINHLVSRGYHVLLLPIWDLDVQSNNELLRLVNHPNISMVKAYGTYDDFTREVKKCDAFVGQKLHASIMALMCGVPTIMIEYQPKCRDFMASVGLENYVIRTSDLTIQCFNKKFDELLVNRRSLVKDSGAMINKYKKLQYEYAEKISN